MKNRHTTFATILLAPALAWVAPAARATCEKGCLSNFNTALGEDALLNGGSVANTAVGFNAGKSSLLEQILTRPSENMLLPAMLWAASTLQSD